MTSASKRPCAELTEGLRRASNVSHMKRPRQKTNASRWPLPCVFSTLCHCARSKRAENLMLSFLRVRLNRPFVCLFVCLVCLIKDAAVPSISLSFRWTCFFSLFSTCEAECLCFANVTVDPGDFLFLVMLVWSLCFRGRFCFQANTVIPHHTGRTGFPSLLYGCTRGMASSLPPLCSAFEIIGLTHSS